MKIALIGQDIPALIPTLLTDLLFVGKQAADVWVEEKNQAMQDVLQRYGIAVSYETLVPNIINRRGDGICPFELAVTDCADPDSSYAAILRKMDELHIPLWD